MEEINITYDECFLEPLTKRILLNLVRNMSEKYINKNLPLDGFYETNSNLYKTAADKRTPKFKRKRILIITSSPLNSKIVEKAINNINEKYKIKKTVFDIKDQVETINIKSNDLDLDKWIGSSEFSDIIAFTKEKKGNSTLVSDIVKEMRKDPYSYPNLIEDMSKECNVDNIQKELEKTLYVAFKLNDDSKSKIWKIYAIIDKLYDKLKGEIYTANRKKEMMQIFNRYAIICKPNELPYFPDSKILVLGNSTLSRNELENIISQNGLDPSSFDFNLEYKKASINIEKYKGCCKYKAIIFGPTPHKMKGSGDSSSPIQLLKDNENLYPKIFECRTSAGELKITNNSFTEQIKQIKEFY